MKRVIGNGLLAEVMFIVTILSVMTVFSTLESYPFATPNENNLYSIITFVVWFRLSESAVIRACSSFSDISVK